jgi:hypothetical protein
MGTVEREGVTDQPTIADLVAEMLERGVAHDLVVLAVRAFVTGETMSTYCPPDIADIKRTKWRAQKQRQRGNLNKNGQTAKANDVAASTHCPPDMSTGHADTSCNLSSLSLETTDEVKKERKKVTARGSRLSADVRLSAADRAFALESGVTDPDALWAEFVDYWSAVPGQRGTKLSWSATWRNRVRQVTSRNGKSYVTPQDERTRSKDQFRAALRQLGDYARDGEAGEPTVQLLPPA